MIKFVLASLLLASASATGTPSYKECGTCCFDNHWYHDQCANQDHTFCMTGDEICQFESGPDRMNEPLHQCGEYCCRADGTQAFEIWVKCTWYADEAGLNIPGTNDPVVDTDWCGEPCCEDYAECCYANYRYADQCQDKNDPHWSGTCISPGQVCDLYHGYSLCSWSSEYCCSSHYIYKVEYMCDVIPYYFKGVRDGDFCEKECFDDSPATFGKTE